MGQIIGTFVFTTIFTVCMLQIISDKEYRYTLLAAMFSFVCAGIVCVVLLMCGGNEAITCEGTVLTKQIKGVHFSDTREIHIELDYHPYFFELVRYYIMSEDGDKIYL